MEKPKDNVDRIIRRRKIWGWIQVILVTAMLLGIVGYSGYGYMTFQPHGPQRLDAAVAASRVQSAQAIARAQLARMESRPQPPPRPACRPLPVRINRAGLEFWGRDAQNQPVQLVSSNFGIYSDAEMFGIWYVAAQLIASTAENKTPPKALADEALHARLQRARERIVNLADASCAYEWDVIRGIVLSHGDQLVMSDIGEVNPLADYDPRKAVTSMYQQAKRMPAESAKRLSDIELSLAMVENATALVFARSVTILSGYTPDTLDAFRTMCVPFNISYEGFEAAAVLWNRGRFLQSIRASLTEEGEFKYRKALKAMDDVDRDQPRELIAQMEAHSALAEMRYQKTTERLEDVVRCDFPPVLDGPTRGSRVRMDELNDPVVNYVDQVTSQLSKQQVASIR